MARFVILAVLLMPIVEIAIFIKVGQTIGLFPTLGLVIGATLLGGLLLRLQGLSVLNQMRGNLSRNEMPGRAIADGMMLGLAALLLVLPGFFSDFLALLLLLPPVRAFVYKTLASRIRVVQPAQYSTGPDPYDPRLNRQGTIDLDEDEFRPR